MAVPFLLSEAQMRIIFPHFPLSHGVPRVDDRRVVSGIVYVIRNGLQWRDAPKGYGPHKTLYNRFIRWSQLKVFDRIFMSLVEEGGKPNRLTIDATHLKVHRTSASLLKKGDFPAVSGAQKAGLNTKPHVVCDGRGRPVIFMLTPGQTADIRAANMIPVSIANAISLRTCSQGSRTGGV